MSDMPETIWANEYNEWAHVPLWAVQNAHYTRTDHVQTLIAEAVAAAWERCAKVAEDYDGDGIDCRGWDYQLGDAFKTRSDIAAAIRQAPTETTES